MLLIAAGFARGFAQPPGEDDDEDRRERTIVAERALSENCLICHAATMIEGQRLTPAQWRAEVEKMMGWGSPLPVERKGDLVAYLASRYAVATPERSPARFTAEQLRGAGSVDDTGLARLGDPARGLALYKTQCFNCHAEGAVGGDLGPNLVEKPILTRWDEYSLVMRAGRRRMPGFKLVFDERAERDVLAYLRGLRGPNSFQSPPKPAP